MPIPDFANCYWVVPQRLLAGEYPGDKHAQPARAKLAALQRAGITLCIDLTEAGEGLEPYAHLLPDGMQHLRFGIPDISIPVTPQQTRHTLDAIDAHLAAGRGVYLHCWGGVGRTGVIVGCWLARQAARQGVAHPGQAGLHQLKELWMACPKSAKRVSPETPQQEVYILNWQEPLP